MPKNKNLSEEVIILPAKYRNIILTVVIILVVGVLARPYIPFLNPGGEEEFATTPQPYSAYEEALQGAKPIFLEFYAGW